MADVPGERDHGPFLRIHYRVLDDVGLACHVAGKKLFRPAWHSADFGQESTGKEAIIRSHLPKDDVFRQHVITTEKRKERNPIQLQHHLNKLAPEPLNTTRNILIVTVAVSQFTYYRYTEKSISRIRLESVGPKV